MLRIKGWKPKAKGQGYNSNMELSLGPIPNIVLLTSEIVLIIILTSSSRPYGLYWGAGRAISKMLTNLTVVKLLVFLEI